MLRSIGEHVKSGRIGPYDRGMDAATADALLVAARDARVAMRSGDDAAVGRLEVLYSDLHAALEWNVE